MLIKHYSGLLILCCTSIILFSPKSYVTSFTAEHSSLFRGIKGRNANNLQKQKNNGLIQEHLSTRNRNVEECSLMMTDIHQIMEINTLLSTLFSSLSPELILSTSTGSTDTILTTVEMSNTLLSTIPNNLQILMENVPQESSLQILMENVPQESSLQILMENVPQESSLESSFPLISSSLSTAAVTVNIDFGSIFAKAATTGKAGEGK